jgi:hypothetical protein
LFYDPEIAVKGLSWCKGFGIPESQCPVISDTQECFPIRMESQSPDGSPMGNDLGQERGQGEDLRGLLDLNLLST